MAYLTVTGIIFLVLLALGKKWEIRSRYVLPWAFLMGLVACAGLYLLDTTRTGLPASAGALLVLLVTGVITAVVVSILFFRDPERIPPQKNGVILSPADGTVLYVKTIRRGEFPFSVKRDRVISLREFAGEDLVPDSGIQIGIGMNLLNVHVNRAPIGGKVARIKRIPGGYFSLKRLDSLLENERVLTVIEGERITVGVVQIASRLVRRIVSYLDAGENVAIGQRIGMIRFGSQVDLLIPFDEGMRVLVEPGDDVKAGVSIVSATSSEIAPRNADSVPLHSG